MRYTTLGSTGLPISRIALGTMTYVDQTPEDESVRILDAAIEAGINLVDSADVYGKPWGMGVNEQFLGRWLASRPGVRDRIVLATKCYNPMGNAHTDRGLSAYHIVRACEASLKRLATDRIDLFQMHHVDRATPWAEIWQAFSQLIQQGKVLYVGTSNFAAWQIATGTVKAQHRGMLGIVSEQSKYSLFNRALELEVLPCCRHHGIAVLPYTGLEEGLLAGILAQPQGVRRNNCGDRLERNRSRIEAYEGLCRELGEHPASVGLAWLLHQPVVTAPLAGARTLTQLAHSLRAPEVILGDAVLAKLDEIFPPPSIAMPGKGREAPEAYAW